MSAPTEIQIPRDRWGHPLITPADGGEPEPYTRASSLGGVLEDQKFLTLWKQRMTAVGVAAREDLILSVNAHRDDKKQLNSLVKQAMEAAESGARATIGTSMHTYAELVDRGQDPGYIPDRFAADLAAYRDLTEPLFEHVAIEQFCVCDELKVAGTPDRVSRLRKPMRAPTGLLPAGSVLIVDEKTSSSMDWGGIKFAVQLAVYAHGAAYDPSSGKREPWPGPARADWGLIVHCPAGSGTAALWWVNLTAGWELAKLAFQVRDARKRKDLLLPEVPDFIELARNAVTVDVLNEIWFAAVAAGQEGDELMDACRQSKARLMGEAS